MLGGTLLTPEQQEIVLQQRLGKLGFRYQAGTSAAIILHDLLDHMEAMSTVLQSSKQEAGLLQCQNMDLSRQLSHATMRSLKLDRTLTTCFTAGTNAGLWPALPEFNNWHHSDSQTMDDYYDYRINRFDQSFTSLSTRVSILQTDNDKLTSDLSMMQRDIDECRHSQSVLKSELYRSRNEAQKSAAEVTDLRQMMEVTGEELAREKKDKETAVQRVRQMEIETERMKGEASVSKDTMDKMEREVERLTRELKEATDSLEVEVSSSKEVRGQLELKLQECTKLSDQLTLKDRQVIEEKKKQAELSNRMDELQVRMKVGLLTADRLRQAEAKEKESSDQLLKHREKLTLLEQEYYVSNKNQSESAAESRKTLKMLQNQVKSTSSYLEELKSECEINQILFSKLREKVLLLKGTTYNLDSSCLEDREELVECVCTLIHDLESKIFIITLENTKLQEETDIAVESNEKLWFDVEQLMEEVLRLRASQDEPQQTHVAAECLDQYIKQTYAEENHFTNSKCNHYSDIEAYRKLVADLQASATRSHESNLYSPDYAHNPHTPQIPPESSSLRPAAPSYSLQSRNHHQQAISKGKSEKTKRSLNQKSIRERISAMAKELDGLKVGFKLRRKI